MQFSNHKSLENYLLFRGIFIFVLLVSILFSIAKMESNFIQTLMTVSIAGIVFILVFEHFFRPVYFSILHQENEKQTYIDVYIPDNHFLIVLKSSQISRKRIPLQDEIIIMDSKKWFFIQRLVIGIEQKRVIKKLIDFSVFFNSETELARLDEILNKHNTQHKNSL